MVLQTLAKHHVETRRQDLHELDMTRQIPKPRVCKYKGRSYRRMICPKRPYLPVFLFLCVVFISTLFQHFVFRILASFDVMRVLLKSNALKHFFCLFQMENRENRCLIRTPLIKLLKPTITTRNRNVGSLPETRDVLSDWQHRLQHLTPEI